MVPHPGEIVGGQITFQGEDLARKNESEMREIRGGRIAMIDGSAFNPANPIELSAAMSQPAEARGYLALLRAFVNEFETDGHDEETLRSLLAPEVGATRFNEILGEAEAAERSCGRASH